jgi:hypothetical protein
MVKSSWFCVLLVLVATALSSCSRRKHGPEAPNAPDNPALPRAGAAPQAEELNLAWDPFGTVDDINPEVLNDEWRAARELHASVGVPARQVAEATRRLAQMVADGRTDVESKRQLRKDLQIVAVALDGARLTDRSLVALKRLPHLRHVALSDDNGTLSDAAFEPVAGLAQLESFRANRVKVGDGIAHRLENLNRLQAIHLADTRLTDAGLASLSKLTRLVYLDVAGTKITTDGLAALKTLTNLEQLYLYQSPDARCVERNDRIDPLAALPHLAPLTRLTDASMLVPRFGEDPFASNTPRGELSDPPWPVPLAAPGEPEFEAVAQQWRNRPRGDVLRHFRGMTRLKALDLRSLCCRDGDLVHLAGLLQLEQLSLSGSPISGKGLEHLGSLVKLKYLNLRGTNVRDADLLVLRKLPALRDVITVQSLVTGEGVRTTEAKMPNVKIRASKPASLVPRTAINPDTRPEYMLTDPSPGKRAGPMHGPPIFRDSSR